MRQSRAYGRAWAVLLLIAVAMPSPSFANERSQNAGQVSDALAALAAEHGIAIKGIERTKGVPAPKSPTAGLPDQIKSLLSEFNHVIVRDRAGAVERVIVLGHIDRPRTIGDSGVRHVLAPSVAARVARAESEIVTAALSPGSIRMSSPFGMRRHPIHGRKAKHDGVDIAAPAGTPVRAPSSGVVVEARRNGGYGNYVRIRHDRHHDSVYGHLRGFAAGLAPGKRVERGQVIGYVGSTGQSTGPHLHYEVIRDGRPVDPLRVALPGNDDAVAGALSAVRDPMEPITPPRSCKHGRRC